MFILMIPTISNISSNLAENIRHPECRPVIPAGPLPVPISRRQLFDADRIERLRDEIASGLVRPLDIPVLPLPGDDEMERQRRCIKEGLAKNDARKEAGTGLAHGSGKGKQIECLPADVILATYSGSHCKLARNTAEYHKGELDGIHGHWAVVAISQETSLNRKLWAMNTATTSLAIVSHLLDAGLVPGSVAGFVCMDSREPSLEKLLAAGCPLLYSDREDLECHALLPSWAVARQSPSQETNAWSRRDSESGFKVMAYPVSLGNSYHDDGKGKTNSPQGFKPSRFADLRELISLEESQLVALCRIIMDMLGYDDLSQESRSFHSLKYPLHVLDQIYKLLSLGLGDSPQSAFQHLSKGELSFFNLRQSESDSRHRSFPETSLRKCELPITDPARLWDAARRGTEMLLQVEGICKIWKHYMDACGFKFDANSIESAFKAGALDLLIENAAEALGMTAAIRAFIDGVPLEDLLA